MTLVIQWAHLLEKEQYKERKFLADIHGAKFNGRPPGEKETIEQPLADVFRALNEDVRNESAIGVEFVKISPEELARRQKELDEKQNSRARLAVPKQIG